MHSFACICMCRPGTLTTRIFSRRRRRRRRRVCRRRHSEPNRNGSFSSILFGCTSSSVTGDSLGLTPALRLEAQLSVCTGAGSRGLAH